jgi:acetyltransferase (GNAT) family protein
MIGISAPSKASVLLPIPLHDTESEALAFLLPLSPDYPNIEQWFRTKVVPGLRNNSRILIRVERHGQLMGLAIGKREPGEKKICTVRVAPRYFGRGIGVRLFDGVLRWLDDDKPHLTVSEGKMPAFERIFDFYGFDLTSVRRGLYQPDASEFAYNEAKATALSVLDHQNADATLQMRPSKLPSLERDPTSKGRSSSSA